MGYGRMERAVLVVLGLALLVGQFGCAQGGTQQTAAALNVTVSILPQRYIVERIGGEHVDVNVMVLPGESPATYEPNPEQLRALSEADLYCSIGVPFENAWLNRIDSANDDMVMVDTTQGIERIEEGGNPDPHIWLSPSLVRVQAATVAEALTSADPAHAEAYEENLGAFLDDIGELDAEIRETLDGVGSANREGRRFMVFHPSWRYFARDYGLEMIAIEVGGQEPSAAELARLITTAKEEEIRVIFAQPEFSTEAAETIADEIGGEVLLISPLAEDWLENLRRVAETFAQHLE